MGKRRRLAMAVALVVVVCAAGRGDTQVRYMDGERVARWVNSIDEVPTGPAPALSVTQPPRRRPRASTGSDGHGRLTTGGTGSRRSNDEASRGAREERARFLFGGAQKYRMVSESLARSGKPQVTELQLVSFVGQKCATESGNK